MNPQDIMKISPIVPVIALEKLEDALPLAEALDGGGDIYHGSHPSYPCRTFVD